jgi:hypothetical protein
MWTNLKCYPRLPGETAENCKKIVIKVVRFWAENSIWDLPQVKQSANKGIWCSELVVQNMLI